MQENSALAGAVRDELARKAAEHELPPVRRGRPSKGPRVRIRKDRGKAGMAYMVGDGKRRSLGIPATDTETAETRARLLQEAKRARELGAVAPRAVPLQAVFDDYVGGLKAIPGRTVEQIVDHRQREDRLRRVANWFGPGTTVGDVVPARCRAYDEWLRQQPARRGSDARMTVGNSRMDLGWARAAINRYAFEHSVVIPNGVWVPERPAPRQNWLTRSQLARLLAAALWGWIWDAADRCWATETAVDPATGEARTRRRVKRKYRNPKSRRAGRMAARALLVLFYTGTRSGKVVNLVWQEHPYRGWIDARQGLICRSGLRVGRYAGPGKRPKPAGTSILPAPLLRLVRRWHRADARRGILAVIHKADGGHYAKGALYVLIKPVARRAGLGDMVVHELRHSTVTHCLRAGCSIPDTAAFVDMSEEMVRTVYGHVAEEATLAGALAMADKRHQPVLTSRDLAADMPRELMTPQQAMAIRFRDAAEPVVRILH